MYYASGWLSLSQRRGLISLVFKRGDRLDVRNWHPITLHNVVYKLASRVSAGRLLKVIHVVASKDQTCGVLGRFIGENVALLRDIVDYATLSNVPTAVLSLDQERPLIEWIGHLCWLPCPRWASVHLFFTGFACFIQVFRVVLMSMVINFVPFLCPFSWCSPRLSSFSLVLCAGFGSPCC